MMKCKHTLIKWERFRCRVRVYGNGFGVGLGRTNSNKIKKMGNLHMTSFYVTDHIEKIINMWYGSGVS